MIRGGPDKPIDDFRAAVNFLKRLRDSSTRHFPYTAQRLQESIVVLRRFQQAQWDRNPKGEKPQALSAKHESPVGEADAPKTCPGE